ncbi:MAG: hypothetical protein ACJAWF_000968 [Candidatus Azotimanducaceae bacterium]|jgi:hypothetical protein
MPDSNFSGLSGTDSILEVTVDNGGAAAVNQTFLTSEITSLGADLTGTIAVTTVSAIASALTTDSSGIATLNLVPSSTDVFVLS